MMKKHIMGCCLIYALSLFFADMSFAHRVNIFAYVDGNAIQVECYFSKSQKVRYGKLTFRDRETGRILHEGTTDEQGMFRYRPDEQFLDSSHGMDILLYAGEGHQNDWQIELEELKYLMAAAPPTIKNTEENTAMQAVTVTSLNTVEYEELEALLNKVMDAKLTPIRQAIARQQDDTPDLKDIIGGIGWIMGLLGLAMYLRYRPGQQ